MVPSNVGLGFFGGLFGGSKLRVLFLVGDDRQWLSGVAWGSGPPAHSTLVLCCTVVFAVGYVTRGKE